MPWFLFVCLFFFINIQVLHLIQKITKYTQNIYFSPFTAQFAGEDPVVALEAALQFEDTRESMQAFCVGQYMEVPISLNTCFVARFHSRSLVSLFFLNILSSTA